jgi:hypothetical protein
LRVAPILVIVLASCIPAALAQEATGVRPVFLVGCYDAQTYPPQYLPNFSSAIADLADTSIKEAYGDSVDVLEVGDWFFLLDAINMPNVVGAVFSVTVREGGRLNMPAGSFDRMMESFEAGQGLVGIHGPAYSPYFGSISRDIFPVDGDGLAGGKISREGGIITVRHVHRRRADHFITEGTPESFDAADSFLVYRQDGDGWFTPEEGSMITLYSAQVGNQEVPSIIAYERDSGRSVTFTGLKHTDGSGGYEKDRDWYNHSLGLPEVRTILGRSIVWTLEPLMAEGSLQTRSQSSTAYFEEKLGLLSPEEELAYGQTRLVEGSGAKAMVVLAIGALLILLLLYLGFLRG